MGVVERGVLSRAPAGRHGGLEHLDQVRVDLLDRRDRARALLVVLLVSLARMTDDGGVRRRAAWLARPPAQPFWAGCGVVVVGLAISVGLYAAFSDGPHPFGEAVGLGVLLPGPSIVLVAWLAIRMRSTWLGIAAAVAASGLGLAAAWDATVNGESSTAALAIVGAPVLVAVFGVGALAAEQIVRALLRR